MKLFNRLFKKQPPIPAPTINTEISKGWEHFDETELKSISQMVAFHAYGDIVLNMNDVFAYACAWGVDCDEYDLVEVAKLYEKFGPSGVVAWCAVKEDANPIKESHYPKFQEAKAEILNNRLQYFWIERFQAHKKKES